MVQKLILPLAVFILASGATGALAKTFTVAPAVRACAIKGWALVSGDRNGICSEGQSLEGRPVLQKNRVADNGTNDAGLAAPRQPGNTRILFTDATSFMLSDEKGQPDQRFGWLGPRNQESALVPGR